MYKDEEFIQLSSLQHFVFCPRQCALIHIEQVWVENLFTAEGKIMHENAHKEQIENKKDVRIERGVALFSMRLGLSGKADVVEFRKIIGTKKLQPFPVEYKRGKPKMDDCDKVQLCAQAMCLEEMIGVNISEGAIFYGKTRRRCEILFDETLRSKTEETIRAVHKFIAAGIMPKAVFTKKCDSCSLNEVCMPKNQKARSINQYFRDVLAENEETS